MKNKITNILAIETSCDDTSVAILKCSGGIKALKFEIVENIVSSQIAVHRPFGGVVPNLAKREHLKNLPKILANLTKKHKNIKTLVDCIAVTVGPGLEPALWAGINFAQDLSKEFNKPLIGVNHMEGHIYSCFLPKTTGISNSSRPKVGTPTPLLKNKNDKSGQSLINRIRFPAVVLIVSGGHTILLNMKSITKWEKLGETLDDAAGEAFDKVARMLNLPYPGGPEIQKLAAKGNPSAIKFPRPLLNPKNIKDKYNFSFSGLKTSVLYYLRDQGLKAKSLKLKANVAASFQQAVVDVLVKKTIHAAEEHGTKSIMLCGGVAANKSLRETLKSASWRIKAKFIAPDMAFNTDNAVMIAAAAYLNIIQKNKKQLLIEADGGLTI